LVFFVDFVLVLLLALSDPDNPLFYVDISGSGGECCVGNGGG
jgi:hypothetical protein